MYVHLKQSGELLTDRTSDALWTSAAVDAACDRIAEVHHAGRELDLDGLMVVTGAGNIVRGEGMRAEFANNGGIQKYADAIGRIATIQNALVISAALRERGVGNQVMIAAPMSYEDPTIGYGVEPYSFEACSRVYKDNEVVIIGGGDGEDGHTTDAAVMRYAMESARERPDMQHRVLKSTKHPGIFSHDPETEPDAKVFARVGASYLLESRIGGLDRECLEQLAQDDQIASARIPLDLHVSAASEVTPLEVLRNPEETGTLVVPGYLLPRFREAANF